MAVSARADVALRDRAAGRTAGTAGGPTRRPAPRAPRTAAPPRPRPGPGGRRGPRSSSSSSSSPRRRLERRADRCRDAGVELGDGLARRGLDRGLVVVGHRSTSSSSSSASISISTGSARASTRTRSASPSQPSVSVVARNASMSGSSSGPVSGGPSGAAVSATPRVSSSSSSWSRRSARTCDLDLLEDDADDLARLAGLQEERPLAGLADRAGDEAVGRIEDRTCVGAWGDCTVERLATAGRSDDPDRDRGGGRGHRPARAASDRVGLDLAGAVGRPDLDRVVARPGRGRVPGVQPLDPGRAPRSGWRAGTPATPRRSRPRPSRCRGPAPTRRRRSRPGRRAPAGRICGTSIRDWVRIGPSFDQPSGTQ